MLYETDFDINGDIKIIDINQELSKEEIVLNNNILSLNAIKNENDIDGINKTDEMIGDYFKINDNGELNNNTNNGIIENYSDILIDENSYINGFDGRCDIDGIDDNNIIN